MATAPARIASLAFLALVPLALALPAACHDKASEPAASSAPAPEAPPVNSGPPALHRIVYADHRAIVPLRVGDGFILPDEHEFDWRADFEDKAAFTRATDVDAGDEAYRATKPGLLRVMVFADPKCMKHDGGCGLSKRRWDVTFSVK